MELGGSDPFIVLDDADLDTAVKWAVSRPHAKHRSAASRPSASLFQESIADTFLSRFKNELEKLKPGDPMDPETTLGPL